MGMTIFYLVAMVFMIVVAWLLFEIHTKLHQMHLAMAMTGNLVKIIMLYHMKDDIEREEEGETFEEMLAKVNKQMTQLKEWEKPFIK